MTDSFPGRAVLDDPSVAMARRKRASHLDELVLERWEVAYRALRQLILDGELSPSERVREVELADRFGVSRGPVREALRVLENEGLLVRKPRHGSYVAPLDEVDAREIYEVRQVVEPSVVRLSLERRPIDVVDGLRSAMRAMESALRDGDFAEVARADLWLHSQFYEWAENDRLRSLWDTMKLPLQRLVVLTGGGRDAKEWAQVVSGHMPIVSTAESGTSTPVSRRRPSTCARRRRGCCW
jgi:DNA-binding GntR family transcriptional regulator